MATAQETIRSQIIPVSEIPWQEMAAGLRMKKIWSHEETNRQALMVQIDAGAQLSMHKHLGNELVYVVEGAIQDEFGKLTAGNMGYRPDGCVHTVSSPNGATVIAIITGTTEAAAERGDAPGSQVFELSEIPWAEARPGVSQKKIMEDTEMQRRVVLSRFAPGAKLPSHRHVGDELIYLIEGASADEAGVVATGNMNYRPHGCTHSVTTRNGATVLAVVWGHTEPV